MDLSTALSIVQTILAAIQTLGQLQSVCSISNCKSELDDLQNTVETVRAVLMDADAKQDSLNFQEQNYIKELKDAVYDADDVLDEFLTLAKQKEFKSNKVISFFSRFKLLTHKLSSKVKKVNDKLNSIATKSSKFSFKIDYKPMKFAKEETSSFLYDKIIGREEDVEKIVGMLLGCDNVDQPNVSLLAIMGMGGLGKTALAQLVFDDPRIRDAFPLRRWTCIADQDQDQKQWDLKGFLGKVVKGLTINDKTSLEDIHHTVKRQLEGEKYLLVLDDVWTESYDEWQKFEGFLKVGGRGSWIIVTTRSKTTAQMIGGDQVHDLQGLSDWESWHLFERMAFQVEERDDEIVKLGKEIVKKCINVPLAIRVVGGLLRGQSKSKWLSFHEKGLECLTESNDTMTRILKLSYDHLNASLKACFAYCAIFPKNWEINKQKLIQLWMAQGYINSENLGEEYFLILLQRCLFQEIAEDEFGGIESFKIHDLLHDIAEKVASEEICRFNFDTSNVGKRVRHLSFVCNPHAHHIFKITHIRTCLQVRDSYKISSLDQLITSKAILKWSCLRSLDLSYTDAKILPESIGHLLHLRSLDLSSSGNLEILPKSITKLVNLQTLNLHSCASLKRLPHDVSKLVDLVTLDIVGCDALSCMPAGIGMLTRLQTLCQFIVGDVSKLVDLNTLDIAGCDVPSRMPAGIGLQTLCQCIVGARASSSSTPRQCFNGLEDLQHLNKLKGSLKIEIAISKNAKFVKEEHGGGAYLRSKEHLHTIVINFRRGNDYGSKEAEQALLEEMQPHRDVKSLELSGYAGGTMPRWLGRRDNSALFYLPNLVTLVIKDCSELRYLPWQVGKLPQLKTLDISSLWDMEYVVDVDSETLASGEGSCFFPSLEDLVINELPKLKGWCRNSKQGSHLSNPEAHLEWVSSPCFRLLKNLTIKNCEELMFVPSCPLLENLKISDTRRKLLWADMRSTFRHQMSSSLSYPKSKMLDINNLEWLKSMPTQYSQFLAELCIKGEKRLERLGGVNELFPTFLLSSLRFLTIVGCPKLKSVGGWLEHLSALEYLCINNCPKAEFDGMSWHNLAVTLQSLDLIGLNEMEELPEGIQYCTSLRSLYIGYSPKLKSVPKWMPKLTSLQSLDLLGCSDSLFERCQELNGVDWPLIGHISSLLVLQ